MRHKVKGRKLSRLRDERRQLLKNLVASLILYEKIKTTEAKAKEAKKLAEKLINIGKDNSLNSRRKLLRYLPSNAVAKILEVIGPKYKERKGGYTRIVKIGLRKGDGAKMVMLELV